MCFEGSFEVIVLYVYIKDFLKIKEYKNKCYWINEVVVDRGEGFLFWLKKEKKRKVGRASKINFLFIFFLV